MIQNSNRQADIEDIKELEEKIDFFKQGKIDEEKFKLFRLARGVYGQRQLGVQMFRIKIPFGKITPNQLAVVARVAKLYASGNLHLTTRQDIQLHYVKLSDSPKIWEELSKAGLTGREACGNTVRNVTASAKAGIDPDEPFDVTPYAELLAYHLLRNPICQEMGRKIKIAFSSSDKDDSWTSIHDFGFIPKIQNGHKGFLVKIGGGLGAQAILAEIVYQFLPEQELLPFVEAALRIFDRYGEREKRHKARMKYLVTSLGKEAFMRLVEEEKLVLKAKSYPTVIPTPQFTVPTFVKNHHLDNLQEPEFLFWKNSEVISQKQMGLFALHIKIQLGNIDNEKALLLADILENYSSKDIRITIDQSLLLRNLSEDQLYPLYSQLKKINLVETGTGKLWDITSCPGVDTCNLAVTDSTHIAKHLEKTLREKYPQLIDNKGLIIKISGCMNGCGQHLLANIGFHGSSIKKSGMVIPAMQVVLGGGYDEHNQTLVADKVIKLPTKRVPQAIDILLDDYMKNRSEHNQSFTIYYKNNEPNYFYHLLKPLADIASIQSEELQDWGQYKPYNQAIGVGECAAVALDAVGGILRDAGEKLHLAKTKLSADAYDEAIYYSYTSMVVASKALLLSLDIKCNSQIGIIKDFDTHCIQTGLVLWNGKFQDDVLQLSNHESDHDFANNYWSQAEKLLLSIIAVREKQLANSDDKIVIESYYKA